MPVYGHDLKSSLKPAEARANKSGLPPAPARTTPLLAKSHAIIRGCSGQCVIVVEKSLNAPPL